MMHHPVLDQLAMNGMKLGLERVKSFLYFIGVCECLGALGLILPAATRVQTHLTPLAAAGMTKQHVAAVRIYLIEFPKFYERMNVVYLRYFDPQRMPVRSCVGVAHLTRGALVEMEFVLRRPS